MSTAAQIQEVRDITIGTNQTITDVEIGRMVDLSGGHTHKAAAKLLRRIAASPEDFYERFRSVAEGTQMLALTRMEISKVADTLDAQADAAVDHRTDSGQSLPHLGDDDYINVNWMGQDLTEYGN